ncbi:MAG: DUF1272 domain-containing protein [Nibricoccus sp.]
MPITKEEIRRKYKISEEDFDVIEALALRPTCENCNKPLPPSSKEAMICSFECTFCADCVENVIHNICPNCGGGFAPRPIRPAHNWKAGNYLGSFPARTAVKHKPVDPASHARFSADIRYLPPEAR